MERGVQRIGGALLPVSFGELGFASVGAAEGGGCVGERAEAHCFIAGGQRLSDRVEGDHVDRWIFESVS